MDPTIGVRLYAWLVRAVLPRRFRSRHGRPLIDTVHDRYRLVRRSPGVTPRLSFWVRELAGLARLAIHEQVDATADRIEALFQPPRSQPATSGWHEMLHTIRQDLTYAFRMIVKTPVVSIIAVVSLGIGISANTTIFSVMNRWLLRPLPYPDAERLVMAWEIDRRDPTVRSVSPGNYVEWEEGTSSFSDWMASSLSTRTMTGTDRPEQVTTASVTPNYFHVLETTTLLGRLIAPDEGGPEDSEVAVLSEALWRNRFGADSGVVGRTVLLDGVPHTIIGVVPESFDFLIGGVDLWTAETFLGRRDDRTNRSLIVTAKLRPGVTIQQAQTEMTELASQLEARYPDSNEGIGAELDTVRETFPGRTDRGLIRILGAVVLLVLIVACVNVASLLLAKTDARHRELGIRSALGAGKGRIARQLLTESIVLATIAGCLGLVLAVPGISAVQNAMPDELPGFFAPRFDGIVLVFGVGISLIAGLVFGISPVSQALSGAPMIEPTRGGTQNRTRKRLRSAFVVSEFALALAVLIGAAVLTDLFSRRLSIDPGFDVDNLLTARVTLPEYKYGTDADLVAFTRDLEEHSAELSGVTAYTLASALPRSQELPFTEFSIDGQPPADEEDLPSTSWLSVSPTYLSALDISLLQGRSIMASDREGMPPVVVVNQRFVELFFPDGAAVGSRISIRGKTREIVGILANVTQQRLDGLLPIAPSVYFPIAQEPVRNLRMIFRTQGDPHLTVAAVESMVTGIDPEQPIYAVQTMKEHVALQLAGPSIMAKILLVVGALALALAAIGIYGVMAYNVSLRSREIGIRMALGAAPRSVLAAVTGQGVSLAGVGLLAGTPLAATIVLLIARILTNPAELGAANSAVVTMGPIAAVSAVLAIVGGVASYLPARRAVRVDPVQVLSAE